MSKNRFINTSFWSDTWIVDHLTRDERYFFMYLLTNDKTSIAGVYELSVKMMAFETDFSPTEIAQMFNRLKSRVRYVDGWVVMRNGVKNQNYRNEKIRRGIELVLQQCPAECLQFVKIPGDANITVDKSPPQQRLVDESSMTLEEPLHSNSNSNSNSKVGSDASSHPTSRAAKIDRELAAKERAAKSRRSGSGTQPASAAVRASVRKKLEEKGIVKS